MQLYRIFICAKLTKFTWTNNVSRIEIMIGKKGKNILMRLTVFRRIYTCIWKYGWNEKHVLCDNKMYGVCDQVWLVIWQYKMKHGPKLSRNCWAHTHETHGFWSVFEFCRRGCLGGKHSKVSLIPIEVGGTIFQLNILSPSYNGRLVQPIIQSCLCACACLCNIAFILWCNEGEKKTDKIHTCMFQSIWV